jgi:hypothetical protein
MDHHVRVVYDDMRRAGPADAERVALLHADSWRRHYRGARVGAEMPSVYLWVLEQNVAAQTFYRARGAEQAERCPCRPPGIPVHGDPHKLRMVWPSAEALGPVGA